MFIYKNATLFIIKECKLKFVFFVYYDFLMKPFLYSVWFFDEMLFSFFCVYFLLNPEQALNFIFQVALDKKSQWIDGDG